MKQTLYRKFLICYIMIGILSFFLVSLGGSYLVERHLEQSLSEALYKEANNIASYDTVKHNISSSNLDAVKQTLTAIATFQDADVWIINNQNQIIVNTAKTDSDARPVAIASFDPTEWGGNYYQVGDFYGHFKNDRLRISSCFL